MLFNILITHDFNDILCSDFLHDLKDYEALIFHKNVARVQRNAYQNDIANIEKIRNSLLIEVDFKQKIDIGMSPKQVCSEYYNQSARSCLGELKRYLRL